MNSSKVIIIVGGSFAGIKAAWDLRHRLDPAHRILLLSDQSRTTFRASFPRVIFENLDLDDITMDLAETSKSPASKDPVRTNLHGETRRYRRITSSDDQMNRGAPQI